MRRFFFAVLALAVFAVVANAGPFGILRPKVVVAPKSVQVQPAPTKCSVVNGVRVCK